MMILYPADDLITMEIITMVNFKQKVLKIVSNIPRGKTLSYQEVAILAGSPKSYRAVGNILRENYDPKIPCHRVIRSDGQIGGYNRGQDQKINLLKAEKAYQKAKA